MKNTIDRLIKIGVWTTVLLLIIRCIPDRGTLIELWMERRVGELIYSIVGYVGEAIAVSSILMKAFDLWVWKWPIVRRIIKTPVLYKEYKGKIISSYDDNKEYKGTLSIKQTYTSISIRFKTKESSSYSITAAIVENNDVNQLIYTYQNDPKANIQKRSPIHHGTAILEIDNVERIEGNYFTERGHSGSMVFLCQKKPGGGQSKRKKK